MVATDRANVGTCFTAFHRVRSIGDPLAGEQAYDTEMDYFVAGRYIDQFESREGDWGIVSRTGMTDWARLEAPSSQGMGMGMIAQDTVGKRAPENLICQFYSTRT